MFTVEPIGVVRTPYSETAQIPKGPGAAHRAEGVIELRPEFEPGLLDIDGFSHLYVVWLFDRVTGVSLTATPPTDTRAHGVFATRSPARPNRIGLTVVSLIRREGASLVVRGVDMLDATPVLDIKPYLSSVPAEDLRRGWLDEAEAAATPQKGSMAAEKNEPPSGRPMADLEARVRELEAVQQLILRILSTTKPLASVLQHYGATDTQERAFYRLLDDLSARARGKEADRPTFGDFLLKTQEIFPALRDDREFITLLLDTLRTERPAYRELGAYARDQAWPRWT